MPQKGVSKKKDRTCLICTGQTRVAFLGIDVCRACSVFYKRAEENSKSKEFTCRASTKNCPVGPDLNCKRCRYDHIERLLKQAQVPPQIDSSYSESSPGVSESPKARFQENSPSTSSNYSQRSEMPILDRLKTQYRAMCWMRLNSELQARPNPPHPREISLEAGPFFPASFASLTPSNRILLTALIDFGACAFSEFGHLPTKEKWDIVINSFYRFRLFEGIYRASLAFPDDLDRTFGGYSTWVSAKCMDVFCSDAPTGDHAGVKEYFKEGGELMNEIPKARAFLQRVNPCPEEFLFVIALMFWTFDSKHVPGEAPIREEVTQLGERYRQEIMKELHIFYREQQKVEDYAARLGELLMFLSVFDRGHEIKQHFEMLRLLDIFPEDNFTYQLQKED
ncbi:hypothetical protein PENTCL1PPCAC_15599 [Pristionchus entomophagus]|uniref:Nuclear receptor n=1 Tax=Pristionchus entomophagus TaxID=358040 RepID=A0AAV5TDM7_9BILA|nr:hypothetical protein PENTCL1PPCAC_15599 [Pristionchus entomophagus]